MPDEGLVHLNQIADETRTVSAVAVCCPVLKILQIIYFQ